MYTYIYTPMTACYIGICADLLIYTADYSMFSVACIPV